MKGLPGADRFPTSTRAPQPTQHPVEPASSTFCTNGSRCQAKRTMRRLETPLLPSRSPQGPTEQLRWGLFSMGRPRTFSQVLKGLRTIVEWGASGTVQYGLRPPSSVPNPMPALKPTVTLACGVNGALLSRDCMACATMQGAHFGGCAALTAMVFSLMPPTGRILPVRETSPVMARFCRTGLSMASESRAVTMVQPALGPSLGVAPWWGDAGGW